MEVSDRQRVRRYKRWSLIALVVLLSVWIANAYFSVGVAVGNIGVMITDYQFCLVVDSGPLTYGGPFYLDSHGAYQCPLRLSLPGVEEISMARGGPAPIYKVLIPIWLPTSVVLATYLGLRRRDQRTAIPPGCCVHCGYDGSKCTDNRCSECGEPLAVEAVAAG